MVSNRSMPPPAIAAALTEACWSLLSHTCSRRRAELGEERVAAELEVRRLIEMRAEVAERLRSSLEKIENLEREGQGECKAGPGGV